jgi:hypothetical protein
LASAARLLATGDAWGERAGMALTEPEQDELRPLRKRLAGAGVSVGDQAVLSAPEAFALIDSVWPTG